MAKSDSSDNTDSTDTDTFVDRDGVTITFRRWLPSGAARAIVQIAHGASEHSEPYARFASFLKTRGYAVFAEDHRGHGLTAASTGVGRGGPRGWEGMVDDLQTVNELARKEVGDLPVVLFGHSMGSFLAQRFIQRYGDELAGVVLSGSSGGLAGLAETVAALETMPQDDPAPIFGPLNAGFEPARTP